MEHVRHSNEGDYLKSPLFQVMLSLEQTEETNNCSFGGMKMEHLDFKRRSSMFDLTFIVSSKNGFLDDVLEYNTGLFLESTIKRISDHFRELLTHLDSAIPICELKLFSEQESSEILQEWNYMNSEILSERRIHRVFDDIAMAFPNACALVYEGNEITFNALKKRKNQIARILISRGLEVEDRVGLCMGRNPDMIAAILGVLSAGCCFVPLDPKDPQDRLDFLLEDASVSILLTQSRISCQLDAEKIILLREGQELEEIWSIPELCFSEKSLAYIIYTSGTTGRLFILFCCVNFI